MSSSNTLHYEVTAFNSAKHSENKMHHDALARSLGYSAGLVPGVDLIAYLSQLPLRRWRETFLTDGALHVSLLKPVYDGDIVKISATDAADRLNLVARTRDEVCAEGHAVMAQEKASFDLAHYAAPLPPNENDRPEFDDRSLPAGTLIGTRPHVFTVTSHAEHLQSVREADPIYLAQHIIHPGSLSRLMNWALSQNFRLPPWIHAAARLRFLAPAHVGDRLTARAKIISNDKRRDRHRIQLDGLVVANDHNVIAHISHKVYITNTT